MTGLVWLLIGAGLLSLVLTAYAAWRGAPWLPTPQQAVEAALDAADVRTGGVVVDLGAGDGRVLLAAARRGAFAVGYELSPFLWLVAWLRTRKFRQQITVKLADGFGVDLSAATVIFAFLRPATMSRLEGVIGRLSAPTNLRVATYAFPLPDREPARVLRVPRCAPIFLYEKHETLLASCSPRTG